LGLIPASDGEQHHATSPTVVKVGNEYQLTIILRSNITTEQFPDGMFHAHPEFHIIKKESIGLIEAQGLFILPGRLQNQLAQVERCIANGILTDDLKDFQMVYDETVAIVNKGVGNIHKAMEMELGSICERILKNTAVFKDDTQTIAFMQGMGFQLK
jgi:UDPglucose--hexose-1-phosphate uridylyltransferase